MKNMKIVTLAIIIALNAGLIASETQTDSNTFIDKLYIGVDIGSTQLETKVTNNVNVPALAKSNSSSLSDTSSGFSQTLKLGYMFNANNSAMVFYQNSSAEDIKVSMYGVGYDYLIGESSFQPFLGVFAGRSSINDSKNNLDASAINYGAQVGVSYILNANISLEAGYRFMKSNMEQSASYSDTAYGYPATLKETAKVDKLTNMFVGVNYKF
ncbi:MAG: outer membrane beta-barrel protein [Campylobacterales bacterium]|nr:outer membrane beta-barrel protein [Campylobacterales bacterium]